MNNIISGRHLAFVSFIATDSHARQKNSIVLKIFPQQNGNIPLHFQRAKSQWDSHSAVLLFLSSNETVSGIPWHLSTEGNPWGHSRVLLMFFFSSISVKQAYKWSCRNRMRAGGKLWYRVPMATTQNGMHSPWQQSWRGNLVETESELVLASGRLKWCMHGSSTALT